MPINKSNNAVKPAQNAVAMTFICICRTEKRQFWETWSHYGHSKTLVNVLLTPC